MIHSIVNYFEKEFELSAIEKAKLRYSMDVLFTDISKLLILLITFSLFGKSKEYIYSVVALLTIRPFTGGLHYDTYLSCLLFTATFFSIVIILNSTISLSYFAVFIFAFSFIVIYGIAPITHKNRPGYSKNKKSYFKTLSLVIVLIHFVSYLISMKSLYLNISIWVILLQSFQLLIKKGADIYEKKKNIHQKCI